MICQATTITQQFCDDARSGRHLCKLKSIVDDIVVVWHSLDFGSFF